MQNKQIFTQSDGHPLISFIIPYYNLPKQMLKECLESILALTLNNKEKEIIVVDDGSTESALEMVRQIDDRIIYLRQPNGGLSEARNTGMRLAKGKYIQFVDGDDRLLTSPYNHCLDLIRFKAPDMVVFDFINNDMTHATYRQYDTVTGAYLMRHHNIKASACTYIFRKEVAGELSFTHGIYHEDEEFTPLLLLRCEKVIMTDVKAYYYRQREQSIMNSRNRKTLIKRLNDFKWIIQKLHTLCDSLPAEEKAALQRRVAQLTMDYLYNIMTLTQSRTHLEKEIAHLEKIGLYPLPIKNYTKKYELFSKLSASKRGLSLLFTICLLHKRKKTISLKFRKLKICSKLTS